MSSAPVPPLPAPWVLDANRDPPVYTRPMVGSELAAQRYWDNVDADGEICIGLDFTSPLEVEELKDRAREALDKLRFVCPIIACTVEDVVSPRWVYTPSGDRGAWRDLALAVEERGTLLDSHEFVQSISLKRLPYADSNGTAIYLRAYLLTTSKESESDVQEYGLYFHGSHTIIDARPAFHALNLMCEWISGEGMDVRVEASEEWKNLPVDPITAVGGPSDEWETAGVRLLREFAEQNSGTAPCHALAPPSRPLNMSHPPSRYITTASELETTAVIAEAKRLGVSVSALFHAAHRLAQIKMNLVNDGTEVGFSTSINVSLERYMKPPVDPRTHFISSFTMMPLRFSMADVLQESSEKERLIKVAKMLQERFDRYLANPCLSHLLVATGSPPATSTEQDRSAKPTGEVEAPMSWFSAFNNIDAVEKRLRTHHGKVTIGSIGIGGRARNFITAHVWTIHSKLHFQVQGATAWGEECLRGLLEETRRIGLLVLDKP